MNRISLSVPMFMIGILMTGTFGPHWLFVGLVAVTTVAGTIAIEALTRKDDDES